MGELVDVGQGKFVWNIQVTIIEVIKKLYHFKESVFLFEYLIYYNI